jgi:hypothetical protein
MQSVSEVRQFANGGLSIAGILRTKWRPELVASRDMQGVIDVACATYGVPAFDTIIRYSKADAERSAFAGVAPAISAPSSRIARDYAAFADELAGRIGKGGRHGEA